MQTGISSLSIRRWGVLGLIALFALAVGAATTSASSASAGRAVAAKKKCKKGKKSAAAAKKRKCKKKKVTPVVLPAPAPLVRGSVTWTATTDLDLHAYDASGNHSGFQSGSGVLQGIPNSLHSGDVVSGGTESFTDNIFVQGGPSNREFSYIVCFYGTASATFTGVTRTGQSSSVPLDGISGEAYTLTTSGGPPLPSASLVC